jgi:hypothetical protein
LNTSQAIKTAEHDVRMAFKRFDVKSAALRATYSPPDDSDSLGNLIIKASQADPKIEHSKIEAQFQTEVKAALEHIPAALLRIEDFHQCSEYLTGKSDTPPGDSALHQLCDQAKAGAGLGVGSVDLHALAADIIRILDPARAELLRVNAKWVEQTKSASIVAVRGKRYLLSLEMKSADVHIQEAKLSAVQKLHDRRFGANTSRRRTEIGSAR